MTVTLNEQLAPAKARALDVIALDDALNELARMNPQHGRIVELRFFAGLSIEETAHALGISPATAKRDWAVARSCLPRTGADHAFMTPERWAQVNEVLHRTPKSGFLHSFSSSGLIALFVNMYCP